MISVKGKQTKTIYDHNLILGTVTHSLGEIYFKAHSEYALPASITITREAGKWFVSFSYEVAAFRLSEEELIGHYSAMSEESLITITHGMDRGVVVSVAVSDATSHDFTSEQKQGLARKEIRRKRYERQMANRIKGSGHVRYDFVHKTSRKIVDFDAEVFVFENLNVQNMIRAPKPKQRKENDKYLPNDADAKAGLNKAILESAWDKTKLFTVYKAGRVNKLVIAVPPQGMSQECSKCSHTHPDNRQTQALFVCQNCGFTENADFNASLVTKKKGISMLVAGELSVKQKKRAMRLKKKQQLGQELPEGTRVETELSRTESHAFRTHLSANRETRTTTVLTV